MPKSYCLVVDNLDIPDASWSGFLVEVEGAGQSRLVQEKVKAVIEDLWIAGALPQSCFVNGFNEENIIMARVKKDIDRELLPIEEAGNHLIELIERVAAKTQAQQDYQPLASMVAKIFEGRETQLTEAEITQAQDGKLVRTVISNLTRAIAEVELYRQKCQDQSELILGIIQLGDDGEYRVNSTQAVVEAAEATTVVNNHRPTPKTQKVEAT
ncbi:MAG: hypothetical protein HC835_19310 [Oscillatoriales cyanobacterium RM2_1_1]|nr:hypothetical protein [Oscillatoriales cyanobacterium SM2_3_0]NJO47573.1 hypothetical protein [Oscillatoriales cyanobacterium RM2_1_1]